MFLHVGFSRCLQTLLAVGLLVWFSCSQRSISKWCMWCLAAQTVAARHLSNCQQHLLSSAPCVHKSTELLRHKTPDFTPDMWPSNRPDLNPVDYILWTVNQKCIHQKQQRMSNIVDELWLLIEWRIIFHKVGQKHPSGEVGNSVANLLQHLGAKIITMKCHLTKLLQK